MTKRIKRLNSTNSEVFNTKFLVNFTKRFNVDFEHVFITKKLDKNKS